MLAQELNNEAIKEQFLRQAPIAWQELLIDTEVLRFDAKVDFETHSTPLTSSNVQVALDGANRFFWEQFPESNLEDLIATNRKYGFSLRKVRNQQEWAFRRVVYAKDAGLEQQLRLIRLQNVSNVWLKLDMIFLPDLVASDGFCLLNVCANPVHPKLVDVSFEWNKNASNGIYYPEGLVTLDPANYWSIVRYEVIQGYRKDEEPEWPKAQVSAEVVYGDSGLRFLTPTKARYELDSRAEGVFEKRFISFQNFSVDPADSSVFYLTEYGFPEPSNSGEIIIPWKTISVICILLVLGLFFRRFATK